MSLQLVHQRLTNAAFFTAAGDVVEPAELAVWSGVDNLVYYNDGYSPGAGLAFRPS